MPTLTLLAGPNGAGKTRYSEYLRKQGILKVNPLTVDFLVSAINEHYKSMLNVRRTISGNIIGKF